jgi:hypothetical protein
MLALFAALALSQLAMNSSTCADPAIVSAHASTVGDNGRLTTYDVAVTLQNLGLGGEASSLLQSVQVFQDETKVDQIGAPPLRPGGRATVHYRFQRASEARAGSTHLRFRLVERDPHGVPITDCSAANDTMGLRV